jgi:hypothetical protein
MRVDEGMRGMRLPVGTTAQLYAPSRLERYVPGSTFALARLG